MSIYLTIAILCDNAISESMKKKGKKTKKLKKEKKSLSKKRAKIETRELASKDAVYKLNEEIRRLEIDNQKLAKEIVQQQERYNNVSNRKENNWNYEKDNLEVDVKVNNRG